MNYANHGSNGRKEEMVLRKGLTVCVLPFQCSRGGVPTASMLAVSSRAGKAMVFSLRRVANVYVPVSRGAVIGADKFRIGLCLPVVQTRDFARAKRTAPVPRKDDESTDSSTKESFVSVPIGQRKMVARNTDYSDQLEDDEESTEMNDDDDHTDPVAEASESESTSPVKETIPKAAHKRSVGVKWNNDNKDKDGLASMIDPSESRKTHTALQKKKTGALSSGLVGEMEAVGEEICDFMDLCLKEMRSKSIFQGVPPGKCHEYVHFEHANINQDWSHVIAYWKSDVLEEFWASMELDNTITEEKAAKFKQKTVDYMEKQLQQAESVFRSYLIRKMDFRRVPRIEFRPYFSLHETPSDVRADSMTQLLRQNALQPTYLHPRSVPDENSS
jgi:hypothetical protein